VRIRIRLIASVAVAVFVLAGCGARVVPLAQGQGGPVGPIVGPAQSGVNPTGVPSAVASATSGPRASNPAAPPPNIIKANCHGGATDTGVTSRTIKLGLVASLTGPLPGQFNSAVEAADAYFKSVNDAGGICGRKVQLLIRDDNGSGSTDADVAKKLATEDKIFAFVGSVSAPDDSGIAKVSKQYRIPDVGFPLTWQRTENPYTYGVPGQIQRRITGEGASGTKWLNELYGIKQIAVFWLRESEVSVVSAWGFEAADVKASNGAIKVCHEQPTGVLDNNFTNYVVSMQGDCNPANGKIAVYTTMENNSNIKLAKAMQGQGFKPTVFAPTFSSYLPSFIDQAGGATEGAYIAMPQVPFERLSALPQSQWSKGTFELQRYVNTLRRYYPRPSPTGSWGAPGWGIASLFAEAAAKCGAGLTRKCIFSTFDSMGPFSASGFLSPTKPSEHLIYSADLLVQVRNGRFIEVKPTDRSGPVGAPDFWDVSKLFNWQKYMCSHPGQFPNMNNKRALLSEC
jgi:ABC-type branched-subunit amino acid transport system substrate-binding protein